MKYVHVTSSILVLALGLSVMSGSLYAEKETSITKIFLDNAVGIATSSLSMRNIKEKFLRIRNDSSSLSLNEPSVAQVKKSISTE